MEDSEQQIYEEKKLSEFFVADWMSKFPNDPIINQYLNKIKDLEKEVFDY